jgi:hypothetical protein
MKSFNQFLAEGPHVGVSTTVNQTGTTDTYDIQDPNVLKRVIVFDSENAVDQLRNFLQRIGLTFGKVEIPESGSVSVPLTQWGGRFGKDGEADYDEFVNDDGISNRKEGGLSLRVETEAVGKTGSWKVYAKII